MVPPSGRTLLDLVGRARRRGWRPAALAGLLALIGVALPPRAAPAAMPAIMAGGLSPGEQCRAAIARAERTYRLPPHLLAAIGRVESGRRGADGTVTPWPYSLNVEGADESTATKTEAIARVHALLAGGTRSIDVGCLQVNLMFHPDAFASLEEAFDPWRNADYAARFLTTLHDQTGSWTAATAAYHSATPELGGPYAEKVRAALADEAAEPAQARQLSGAGLWAGAAPRAAPAMGAVGRPAPGMTLPRPGAAPAAGRVAGTVTGRGLDAYRSNPVRVASALLRR